MGPLGVVAGQIPMSPAAPQPLGVVTPAPPVTVPGPTPINPAPTDALGTFTPAPLDTTPAPPPPVGTEILVPSGAPGQSVPGVVPPSSLVFTFGGQLTTTENSLIPALFLSRNVTLSTLACFLETPAQGQNVIVSFFIGTLATGAIAATPAGQVVIPAGSNYATQAVSISLQSTQFLLMQITQVGTSPNFGSTLTAIVFGA